MHEGRTKNDISKLGACIRILPILPTSSPIPLQKLSPRHQNLHTLPSTTNSTSSHVVNQPTPLYNTALLLALTPKGHLLSTHALMNSAPAFKDALSLLRVWANQRGYGQGKRACVRGFDRKGHLWAELIRFLIVGGAEIGESMHENLRKPLGSGLSSYQLFRSALDFLCESTLLHRRAKVQ
jgi:U3 small nucleolar RNA-associated protein 22